VVKGIDDYRSTSYLTFDQYRYYLFKEVSDLKSICHTCNAMKCNIFSLIQKVFSALPDEMSLADQYKQELLLVMYFFFKAMDYDIKKNW